MGVHLTFVRSIDLDEWTPEQLKIMSLSGNKNAANFFRANGIRDLHIKCDQKYNSAAARQYKNHLKKLLAASKTSQNETPDIQPEVDPVAVSHGILSLCSEDIHEQVFSVSYLRPRLSMGLME